MLGRRLSGRKPGVLRRRSLTAHACITRPEHSISSRRHKPRARPGTTMRPAIPQTIRDAFPKSRIKTRFAWIVHESSPIPSAHSALELTAVHTPQEVLRQRILVRLGEDGIDAAAGAKRRVAAFVLDPFPYLLRIEDRRAIKVSEPVDALQRPSVANALRMDIQNQLVNGVFFLAGCSDFKKPTEHSLLRNSPRSIRSTQ